MRIVPYVGNVVRGLRAEQTRPLLEALSRELNIPMNISRMKTGVVADRLVGIDDVGNFIATHGSQLQNGDLGTVSQIGKVDGVASKVVSL